MLKIHRIHDEVLETSLLGHGLSELDTLEIRNKASFRGPLLVARENDLFTMPYSFAEKIEVLVLQEDEGSAGR